MIDETGNKYNRLTVIRRATEEEYKRGRGKHIMWYCQCDCGSITQPVLGSYLISGHTASCGCGRNFSGHMPSKGEQLLTDIFNQNKYIFTREYIFDNLHTNKGVPLRYDFAIFNDDKTLRCLCEVDGLQHFKWVTMFQPEQNDFLHRQGLDRRKNDYALAHNIPLYRIPYWELPDIKTIDDIFTDEHLVKTRYHNDNLTIPS